MINYRSHFILTKTSIKEALNQLTTLGIDAILFVIDNDEKLIGSITDGDVRRGLVKGVLIEQPIDDIIRSSPKYIRKSKYDLNEILKPIEGTKLFGLLNRSLFEEANERSIIYL